ncbi:MAG: hypothetical protein MUC49_04145 [Raineya sp.]|jgi:hypothetical protein|nr:hypothetical protein [Raineya sp.]
MKMRFLLCLLMFMMGWDTLLAQVTKQQDKNVQKADNKTQSVKNTSSQTKVNKDKKDERVKFQPIIKYDTTKNKKKKDERVTYKPIIKYDSAKNKVKKTERVAVSKPIVRYDTVPKAKREYVPPPIQIDSTCTRCKGYKHDRACDDLHCYQGHCSTCKGYKKCVHCAGTMMKNVGLEGCPDCTDGKCRVCRGTGLCAKCEGTGRLPCTKCGGTGKKTKEQIEAEIRKKEAERTANIPMPTFKQE